MWSVKNLKVCKRAVDVLNCKRLVAELDNIFLKEVFFELSAAEGKDNFS